MPEGLLLLFDCRFAFMNCWHVLRPSSSGDLLLSCLPYVTMVCITVDKAVTFAFHFIAAFLLRASHDEAHCIKPSASIVPERTRTAVATRG